ncbi:MAG: thiamine pyrophosphate-dependent dehydrogenase E1 component subunit alpha [Chloroflexi bacterium]|nr:MAG: thiamine pyrophosphate-dependent dehydrogenase E1 component subunit alpha [Chloroflexota bacterium]
MQPDLWSLYRQMYRSRLFEKAVKQLWEQGLISGEMHLGMGEEAVVAGIVDQLQDGDAMALDHRGTPPLLMRGVDPVLLLREFLGHSDGLCSGMGGHMHLFSREHLAASSGIVGASGPAAAGFALAAQYLRPGSIAVAFFGEGAINQGMLMEAFNLAVVWQLPVLFVCKDDEWAITTRSKTVTGGSLAGRARSFGMEAEEIDGTDVMAVWHAARGAIERARNGYGPTFIHAQCVHIEGHFLGDPLFRISREPMKEMREVAGPLLRSLAEREGAPLRERLSNLKMVASIGQTVKERLASVPDPIDRTRTELWTEKDRLRALEAEVEQEIEQVVKRALASEGE